MSWLSSAIDKGRKALGLPVISTSNIGALANSAAKVVAGGIPAAGSSWLDIGKEAAAVVPGGSSLLNGIESFLGANQNGVSGTISDTATNIRNAANAKNSAYDLLHSPIAWLVVVVVVWYVMRKR